MDLLEGGVAAGFGVALVGFEGVREAEFFEEPEDALGAGFLEPVEGEFWSGHGGRRQSALRLVSVFGDRWGYG